MFRVGTKLRTLLRELMANFRRVLNPRLDTIIKFLLPVILGLDPPRGLLHHSRSRFPSSDGFLEAFSFLPHVERVTARGIKRVRLQRRFNSAETTIGGRFNTRDSN